MSKGKVTADEYNRKLQEELDRHGATRDEAVRATNIYFGYGNSTAAQFPYEAQPEPKK